MHEATTASLVPLDAEHNTTDLLEARVRATPDLPLFAVPAGDGEWADVTAAEFRARVQRIAKGIIAAGIEPGERVGFLCATRYEWTLFDFALWYAGAVMVPIYETSSPAQIHWALSDSEAVALMVERREHLARYDEVAESLPLVRRVWVLEDAGASAAPGAHGAALADATYGALAALEEAGVDVSDDELERRRTAAVGSDMATLIYTSGSSGKPKGCILTHTNFVDLVRNNGATVGELAHPGSSTLLFITLAHVFARYVSVLGVHTGVRVGHQSDLTQLMPAFATFKPTFLLAVPRVFEKVYNASEAKAEAAGKGRIFRAAAQAAVEHSKALERGHVPFGLRLRFGLLDRLVLSKLRAALGGRAEWAISGSAPLGEHLGHFYRSLGVRILEGYGLTESTAPATFNVPAQMKFGTTGRPVPGLSVRIEDDGEISMRGPSIFAGYWKNPEATAEVLQDGWFHTGDIGTLDAQGYLTITGRKKEIIVTAGGKNVAPAPLEDPVRAHPLVSQVVVVGDKRPYIAALVTLDTEMMPAWLENNGLAPGLTRAQAAREPLVRSAIQAAIDDANRQVSRAESIRRFEILDADFTEASGHLTPKMSIKRFAILRDYEPQIEAMYAAGAAGGETETIAVAG